MEKNTADMHGGLLIHKKSGMTSRKVVDAVRNYYTAGLPREARRAKWGHSGTLDPFATGLLIILVGNATRLQEELHLLPKTYEATIILGATSDTDDSTGVIRPGKPLGLTKKPQGLRRPEILDALARIKKQTSQTPPRYAAIKIRGKKLYEYARAGEQIEAPKRPITIFDIRCKEYAYPRLSIEVICSTGTYIRAIARDIGTILGTGGYCETLTRSAIGPHTDETAFSLEELPKVIHRAIIPMEQLVSHLPAAVCTDENVAKLKNGREVEYKKSLPEHAPIALVTEQDKLFGIGQWQSSLLVPKKILL